MNRPQVIAAALGLLLVAGVGVFHLWWQAPTSDEAHTLVQVTDPTLDTWRQTFDRAEDRAPPVYYLGVWALGRAGAGLDALRAVSLLGWLAGAAALAWVVADRGGGPAAVFAAAAGASASGLSEQAFMARPYGLTMGALCIAVALWYRSLRRPTNLGAALLALAVAVAVVLHYATVASVVCLAVAEWWARRRDPRRSAARLVALAVGVLPILVLAASIRRSIDVVSSYPDLVGWWSLVGYYVSVPRPMVLPVVVLAVPAAWLVLRDRSVRARLSGQVPDRRAPGPFGLLVILLATTVPLQVVVVTELTSGGYFHRYALGGLIGFVLAGTEAIRRLERVSSPAATLGAVAVGVSVLVAARSVQSENATRPEVHDAVVELGLDSGSDPILVLNPHLEAVLEWGADRATVERVRRGAADAAEGAWLAHADEPALGAGRTRSVVVVGDDAVIDPLSTRARWRLLGHQGTASLRANSRQQALRSERAEVWSEEPG